MAEAVILPMMNRALFVGLTKQAKGVLLFGPPGTGKTLIGKAVARECGATFFAISASSLTSKWVGQSEKMVRTLFAVATVKQPSIVFIDEIDSLLTARGGSEDESSRRVKTEFLVSHSVCDAPLAAPVMHAAPTVARRPHALHCTALHARPLIRCAAPSFNAHRRLRLRLHLLLRLPPPHWQIQLDGATTKSSDFVLVIGATNRPQELDEAARRRFTKRVYVPLPDACSRRALVRTLLRTERHGLTEADVERVVEATAGYSGSDVSNVCKEAAMGALRSGIMAMQASGADISGLSKADLPPLRFEEFRLALQSVKSSVAPSELVHYTKWNAEFGSEPDKRMLETYAKKYGGGDGESGSISTSGAPPPGTLASVCSVATDAVATTTGSGSGAGTAGGGYY